FNVKTITKIAILAAISIILMLIEIPLPFIAPTFYKLDLSELPVLIGGFAMGPVAGIAIELVKILVNFIINGTQTGGIGELANFLVGCAFVVPTAIIYKHKKNLKSAILALGVGILSMTIIGSLLNYFVILPFYAYAGMMPMQAIIAAGNAVNKNINSLASFTLIAVAPFNLIKGVIVTIPTLLLYKRISGLLHK
ncbi:MAG: ECF transporter S component, partial [Oscillospiraceae bacterium]